MKNTTLQDLENNPDKIYQIADDGVAKLLLTELGVVGNFTTEFEGKLSSTQSVTTDCKTHHILALKFTGRPRKADNGYVIYAMPKSQYDLDKMCQFYTMLMARMGMDSRNIHSINRHSESMPRN